ncbi:MAG: NarK/NasA family nitrate transporter [Verrucomicrobia bacterium]|nr:NarK/NasA family nitrate transporter [Verrucomicrobiota bacterium]
MRTNSAFWKAGHIPTLTSAFLYFDVSFMIWVLLGALGNHIASDFDLSPAQKGLMTAIPLLGGSVLRLVLGSLTDIIGARKTALLGLALTLAPLALGWLWVDSLPKTYLVGLMLGVAGASFAVALPMASRWYPAEHQGLALGIAGAGNSGTVFATLLAPRLAEQFGWHAVFGLAIAPLLVVMAVVFFLAKDAPVTVKPPGLAEYAGLLKQRDTYFFCLFYGVTFGGFVGLASFLPILLRDQYAVSKVHAGDLTTLCVLAGSFLRPFGGLLADKIGGIRMLTALYAIIVALVLAVAQLPGLGVAVGLLFLTMGMLGLGNGSVFQLVPQRFAGHVGVITGIVGAAGGVGGFFLPTALGWFKQVSGSYGHGFGAFAALATLALVTLLVAQRQWVGRWISVGGLVRRPVPVMVEAD